MVIPWIIAVFYIIPFNSFEDETTSWNPDVLFVILPQLSIPLRMKHKKITFRLLGQSPYSFNSFEDETEEERVRAKALTYNLSIPLRMKHVFIMVTKSSVTTFNSFEDETLILSCF